MHIRDLVVERCFPRKCTRLLANSGRCSDTRVVGQGLKSQMQIVLLPLMMRVCLSRYRLMVS